MNHNSLVSVIMSVYNGERFLKEAIDSILNQSFRDFEFIIIDDCSRDKTSEILSEYKDSRIVLVNNEANIGLAKSLNIGIRHAKGKFIARMDADDVSLPERLRLQYEYMESHPDVDILGGQAWKIDENGRIIGEITKPISAEDISRYIKYACPVIHPTYFVRKHVYEALHGYREFISPIEDYDFLLRAFEYGFKIENIPVKLIKYRLNAHGMSSSNTLRGMVFTRYILKMHKDRIKGRENDEKISFLKEYKKHSGRWFSFFHNARNYFLRRSKNGNIFIKYLYRSLIFLSSIMHYELFLYTFRAHRSLRWIGKREA